MGTGSVAGEAGLIGPASCAGARIVAEVKSTEAPQVTIKMVERRFIGLFIKPQFTWMQSVAVL